MKLIHITINKTKTKKAWTDWTELYFESSAATLCFKTGIAVKWLKTKTKRHLLE